MEVSYAWLGQEPSAHPLMITFFAVIISLLLATDKQRLFVLLHRFCHGEHAIHHTGYLRMREYQVSLNSLSVVPMTFNDIYELLVCIFYYAHVGK